MKRPKKEKNRGVRRERQQTQQSIFGSLTFKQKLARVSERNGIFRLTFQFFEEYSELRTESTRSSSPPPNEITQQSVAVVSFHEWFRSYSHASFSFLVKRTEKQPPRLCAFKDFGRGSSWVKLDWLHGDRAKLLAGELVGKSASLTGIASFWRLEDCTSE